METIAQESSEIRIHIRRLDNASPGAAGDSIFEGVRLDLLDSEAFPVILPLESEALADLRWYLEEYLQFVGAGDRARARSLEARMEGWGDSLCASLGDWAQTIQLPARLDIISSEPEVHAQPWELMSDDAGPLALRGLTIRRQLQDPAAAVSSWGSMALPLRVLMIVSRPSDSGFIDPRNSIAPVLDALDALPSPQVSVEFCEPPTLSRLAELLEEACEEHPFHVVQFDGHGEFIESRGIGLLAFETSAEDAATHWVEGRELGALLSRYRIPLVVLEACRGSDLSRHPIHGSLAPGLLGCGVGSVIAFSHRVHVKAARLLVERFYREWVTGRSIGESLNSARLGLFSDPSRFLSSGGARVDLSDWFIPQLYQAGEDVRLGVVSRTPSKERRVPAPPRGLMHNFPPPPIYRYHGRARELLLLERCLRLHAAVVVEGMGGMGKTALVREAAAWWLRTGRIQVAIFHSFERHGGADQLVQLLGKSLVGESFQALAPVEQWKRAVEVFRSEKVLLIWDNFESTLEAFQRAEHRDSPLAWRAEERERLQRLFVDLTGGSPAGRLVVTCRTDQTGLPDTVILPLEPLYRTDSLQLLAAIFEARDISTDRPGYERAVLEELLSTLGDHPLSISLVAPHLAELKPSEAQAEIRRDLTRFADDGAMEARNRSLLSSIDFSTKRLSPGARSLLPYLAWFEKGVFEGLLRDFTQLTEHDLAAMCEELHQTGLVRIESLEHFNFVYLHFHPTLALSSNKEEFRPLESSSNRASSSEELALRFIVIYLQELDEVRRCLSSDHPEDGLRILQLEEANFRFALKYLVEQEEYELGGNLMTTLSDFLQRSGRLSERDHLALWFKEALPKDRALDESLCNGIVGEATAKFGQGKIDEAISRVLRLIQRLEEEGIRGSREKTAFHVANGKTLLSKFYFESGQYLLAIRPAQEAIALYRQLPSETAEVNRAGALTELANSLRLTGDLHGALQAAQESLGISRQGNRTSGIVVSLGQIGSILGDMGRIADANAYLVEALEVSGSYGYAEHHAMALQCLAVLHQKNGNLEGGIALAKLALEEFIKLGDSSNEMRTSNILGALEIEAGRLEAGSAWLEKAGILARERDDPWMLATVSQNLAALRERQNSLLEDHDTEAIRELIGEVEDSLARAIQLENRLLIAHAHHQLGFLHGRLGNYGPAEEHALQSLELRESARLPESRADYTLLFQIAEARGDRVAAEKWEAKLNAKLNELNSKRLGLGSTNDLSHQIIHRLAETVLTTRLHASTLPTETRQTLDQIAQLPSLGAAARFLQEIANADQPLPEIPEGLTQPVEQILENVLSFFGTPGS